MRKLQDGIQDEIRGKLVSQILKNVESKKEFLATEESIMKFWVKKKDIIDKIFVDLK